MMGQRSRKAVATLALPNTLAPSLKAWLVVTILVMSYRLLSNWNSRAWSTRLQLFHARSAIKANQLQTVATAGDLESRMVAVATHASEVTALAERQDGKQTCDLSRELACPRISLTPVKYALPCVTTILGT